MKTSLRLLVALSCLLLWHSAKGAPGDLDPSFNPGSGLNESVSAIAVQPDGRIVVAGDFTSVPGLLRSRIARLNPDGTGDENFNAGAGPDGIIRSLALQSDGKVLIWGWFTKVDGTSRNGIARLNADGSVDRSFDPGSGADGGVTAAALQSDGSILIGGSFTHVNGVVRNYLARLKPDGKVDGSFDAGANGPVHAIVLQPDGRILVGGTFTLLCQATTGGLARLNPDGTLDSSFAPGLGVSISEVESMGLQADGRVLTSCIFSKAGAGRSRGLLRLNPDGQLDTSFNALVNDTVSSFVQQQDGKIVIGGLFYMVNGTLSGCVARLQPDGSLDSTFDVPRLTYPFGVDCLVAQPDGGILVGGSGISPAGDRLVPPLARLNADGSIDFAFNVHRGVGGYDVRTAVLQPDGKVIIGGMFTSVEGVYRGGVARLGRDGKLDPSFDPQRIIGTAYGPSESIPVIHTVAVQPDGKVLIGGGVTTINGVGRKHIARLNPDGSLDTSFDPGAGTDSPVRHVLYQSDGKIVITGDFETVAGTSHPSLARLNNDGTLDTSFNPNHAVLGRVMEAVVQPDGKIVVVGYRSISRLNPDGSADSSFNTGTGPDASVDYVLLQSDGKILVGGSFTSINGTGRAGLARLNADGSVDQSFVSARVPSGTEYGFRCVLAQPNGKILVSRAQWVDIGPQTSIDRLNPDGTLDAHFTPGKVLGSAMPAACQRDGRVIITGNFGEVNGEPRFAVARLLGDGPTIITQPESRTNAPGTDAAFSVTASGEGLLSYQWFKDGVELQDNEHISGSQTATLRILAVQIADAGKYAVVVSDATYSTASDPAVLRVRVPPVAHINISPSTEFPGCPTRLVLSPKKASVPVTLDASGSGCDKNAPVTFSWREGANTFASGVITTNLFEVGPHTVILVVDNDGLIATDEVKFRVVTLAQATAILKGSLAKAGLPRGVQKSLAARLELAGILFDHQKTNLGIHVMLCFQKAVRGKVANPVFASKLKQAAQEIIDAAQRSKLPPRALRPR